MRSPPARRVRATQEHVRVHQAVRSNRSAIARRPVARSPFSTPVRRVVDADAVLVADRAAVLDDRPARRGLQREPAPVGPLRSGRLAEDVRHVDRRPRRVDVGQMGEGEDPLVLALEAGRQGLDDRGGKLRGPAPVGGGLERVGGVAGIPQRVAQVRAAEAVRLPGPSNASGAVPPCLQTIFAASPAVASAGQVRPARPSRAGTDRRPRHAPGPASPADPPLTAGRLRSFRSRPASTGGSSPAAGAPRRGRGRWPCRAPSPG